MNKIKVIVLDGSDGERQKLLEKLSNEEIFQIVGDTNDGKRGVELIESKNPDVVVMDLVLQGYDGFELLEQVQTMPIRPRILVVSSLKNEGFAQKALDMGADYYLVKPIESDVVVKRLVDLCERASKRDKSPRTRSLEEKISNIFITVGIPAHIKGYQFLREAIKMAIDEPEIINSITKQLYPSIANRFETSASKVERAIRHAIEVAWNRGKIENINSLFGIKVYDSNEKPTNGEFIALVADKMLVEGA